MANVIALIFVIGLVAVVVSVIRKRNASPQRRLVKDFKRLRRLILDGVPKAHRQEATRLLDDCQQHLDALLRAKDQHRLIGQMAGAAQELTGHRLEGGGQDAVEAFDRQVANDLSSFFASLARISTVIGLQRDEALVSLRQFTEELEDQRAALVELTQALATPTAAAAVSTPSPAQQQARRR